MAETKNYLGLRLELIMLILEVGLQKPYTK
jgi:hypothetical protein